MSKISVCIPAYNHEKYIAYTIQSILDQTFQDFEIIISDDNSSDNTIKIAKNFKDSRIKIIENKSNNGPSINSNIAIENAKFELIALIASDDMMQKDRLAKTFEFMQLNKTTDAVFTWTQMIDENNEQINSVLNLFNVKLGNQEEVLRHFFYKGNFLCAPSCLIKKSVLLSCGGFNPLLLQSQDLEMWIKMLIKGYKIEMIEEKLTFYRMSHSNLSANHAHSASHSSRVLFEMEKCLETFLTIKDIELITKIFPNITVDLFKKELSADHIALYLAKAALSIANQKKLESLSYRNFALNTIYKILHQRNYNEEIFKYLNFSTKEFFSICSSNYLVEYVMGKEIGKIKICYRILIVLCYKIPFIGNKIIRRKKAMKYSHSIPKWFKIIK